MTSQLDLELRDLPRLYSPPRDYSITVDQRRAKFYGAHPGLARNCIAARLCFCNTNETDIETWVADKIEGGLLGIHPHTNTKLYLKSEAFGNAVTMLLTREMIFRCDWDNPEHVILRGLAAAEKIGNYDRIDLQEPMWEGMSARTGGGYHVAPSAFQHPNNKRVFAPGFDPKMAKTTANMHRDDKTLFFIQGGKLHNTQGVWIVSPDEQFLRKLTDHTGMGTFPTRCEVLSHGALPPIADRPPRPNREATHTTYKPPGQLLLYGVQGVDRTVVRAAFNESLSTRHQTTTEQTDRILKTIPVGGKKGDEWLAYVLECEDPLLATMLKDTLNGVEIKGGKMVVSLPRCDCTEFCRKDLCWQCGGKGHNSKNCHRAKVCLECQYMGEPDAENYSELQCGRIGFGFPRRKATPSGPPRCELCGCPGHADNNCKYRWVMGKGVRRTKEQGPAPIAQCHKEGQHNTLQGIPAQITRLRVIPNWFREAKQKEADKQRDDKGGGQGQAPGRTQARKDGKGNSRDDSDHRPSGYTEPASEAMRAARYEIEEDKGPKSRRKTQKEVCLGCKNRRKCTEGYCNPCWRAQDEQGEESNSTQEQMTIPPKMSIQDVIAQAVQTSSAQMMTVFTNQQAQRDADRDEQLDKKLARRDTQNDQKLDLKLEDLEKRMEKKMERRMGEKRRKEWESSESSEESEEELPSGRGGRGGHVGRGGQKDKGKGKRGGRKV